MVYVLVLLVSPYKITTPLHFYFQADQSDNLTELEKEWGTVKGVFPELSDNIKEPATIPPDNPTTTRTSASSNTHYKRPSLPSQLSPTLIPKPLLLFLFIIYTFILKNKKKVFASHI